METFTKIYIAYLGILAVFVCFIYWIAAKLRAERINRIRIEKEKQAAETKIHNLEYEVKSLNRSIESHEGIYQTNQQIIESKEDYIKHKENVINEKQAYIEKLQGQIQNLSNCIERTGIRGTDGVVRKCNLGEIQSVISGNHPILLPKVTIKAKDKFTDRVEKLIEDFNSVRSVTSLSEKECIEVKNDEERDEILRLFEEADEIELTFNYKEICYEYPYSLTVGFNIYNRVGYSPSSFYVREGYTILPASDFIQPKKTEPNTAGGRDWSAPQAFPSDYIIPVGTKVVCVADDRHDDSDNYSVGKIGIVQDKDRLPDVLFNDDLDPTVMRITELAPLNPLDHPKHPQFNKK